MKSEELREFFSAIKIERPENVLTAFFVKKPSPTKMQAFMPQVSNTVQYEIMDLILPFIENQLSTARIVDYCPIGVADAEVEAMAAPAIEQIPTLMTSISAENIYTDMGQLDISKINFYVFKITHNGNSVLLLRQFSKLKKLRKGYLAQFFNNELVATDGNFLGIDDTVDIIISSDDVLILNHISLERIFNYRDQYLSKTNEAMGELLRQGLISNLEQFSDDCCRDVRIMKRFTAIMTQGRLPLFFENYEKVPEIVKELGLDITFDGEGKIEYRDKDQLYHIVTLMSDSYFESLLAHRKGIVKTEEALP